jgi:hypothetical protein
MILFAIDHRPGDLLDRDNLSLSAKADLFVDSVAEDKAVLFEIRSHRAKRGKSNPRRCLESLIELG